MFLIDAIKPDVDKKFKTLFLTDCLGEGSRESTKYPILFLFAFGLLAATKTLFKRNKKISYTHGNADYYKRAPNNFFIRK